MKKCRIKKVPVMAYGGQNSAYGLDRIPDWMRNSTEQGGISNTIQEVPEHLANVEAEKGETVVGDLDGDGMMEHMKIGGKKHSAGGTPLNLPSGSFIFSDTKDMKLTGSALELFNKNPKKKFTPAELARKYDLNKYKAILEDPSSDAFQKKTAQMMLDNNHKKLGQLALLQESKKGFNSGIPNIAADYLSGAGFNSGSTVMQKGGFVVHEGDKYENKLNKSKYTSAELEAKAKELGYDGPSDTSSLQKWLSDNNPELVNQYHSKYGMPKAGKAVDGKWGYRWDAVLDNYKTDMPSLSMRNSTSLPVTINQPSVTPITKTVVPETYNVHNTPFDYLAPDKAAMANSLYNLASVKKYLPWEAPISSVTPTPTFYDPTRELAQNASQAYLAQMGNAQLAGPGGRSRNSQIQGQAAENAGNIIGKYSNMNVGLANQFAGINAEVTNNTLAAQRQRANGLFDKTTTANQQYDNAKREAMGNLTQTYTNAWKNRQNSDALNQMSKYYYIDPATGKTTFRSDAAKAAFFGDLKNSNQSQFDMMQGYYDQLSQKYGPERALEIFKTMYGKETPVNPK